MSFAISVLFIDLRLKNDLDKLKAGSYEERQLAVLIDNALDLLKVNFRAGIQLPKRLWPKEYIQLHGITSLWKFDLNGDWRLLYTVDNHKMEVLCVVLEWIKHKDYERKFNFHRT